MRVGDGRSRPIMERFWAKVDKNGPVHPTLGTRCHLWTGSIDRGGYGHFWGPQGKLVGPHRFAWELKHGPVPTGLQLDHLCRVRACVNDEHLEPVTNRENGLRGICGEVNAARQRAKTHCPAKHLYDEANTSLWKGKRKCRTCDRDRHRMRYQRNTNQEAAKCRTQESP